MTYKYRTAKPADAIACSQIIRDWGDETPWMVPIDHLDSLARFWADQFENDQAWVGETDKGIIGFCARSDDNISALYVAPAARNHGVGKTLLDLAKADRDWITVWAYEKNENARKFYQREGLVEVSREIEVFDDGSRLMDVEHRWTRPAR